MIKLTKKEGEKTQITKIRNERGGYHHIDPTDVNELFGVMELFSIIIDILLHLLKLIELYT